MNLETVRYGGVDYPVRTIELNGWQMAVSTEKLEETLLAMLDDDEAAYELDQRFAFYVPDQDIGLDEVQLIAKVREIYY